MFQMSLIVATFLLVQTPGDKDLDAFARVVQNAFVTNQKAFPFGRASFTYTLAKSATAAAARRGEFAPKYTARGAYVFNGSAARYQLVFSDEDMRAANRKIDDNRVESIIRNIRIATNGENTLYESVTIAEGVHAVGVRLEPGIRDFDRDYYFPLSLGRPSGLRPDNAGARLGDALTEGRGPQVKSVERDVDYEAQRVVKVVLDSRTDEYEYLFDLGRGTVPLKINYRIKAVDGQRSSEFVYYCDDVRFIRGRGWLPFKQTWWDGGDNRCYQVLIDEVDFEKPPDEKSFAIEFAEPTSLVDRAKGVRYPGQRVWNILHLPTARSRGVEKVEFAAVADDQVPTLPGERPTSPDYGWLLWGLAATVAVVGAIFWRRRRGRV